VNNKQANYNSVTKRTVEKAASNINSQTVREDEVYGTDDVKDKIIC